MACVALHACMSVCMGNDDKLGAWDAYNIHCTLGTNVLHVTFLLYLSILGKFADSTITE